MAAAEHRPRRPRRARDQRGVALPSPVVVLSILAIAMAAVAYLATQGAPPTEREVAIVSRDATSPAASPAPQRTARASARPEPKQEEPPVKRGQVFVEVYNNSGVSGLAGQVGGTAAEAGWQVVGTDNWYGSVPSSTVYFPPDLKRAAAQLALDLGVDRAMPLVGGMRDDRLTVVLTGPLG